MTLRKLPHALYYLLELLMLLSWFILISTFSYSFKLQTATLFVVLFFYCALGIFPHKMHHTAKAKIVLEYILVSLVILASFLFVNIGKI